MNKLNDKNAKRRQYPLTEQECFLPQQQALIPRVILEPLFHEYVRRHPPYDKTTAEISGFYKFLLEQSMPEKEEWGVKYVPLTKEDAEKIKEVLKMVIKNNSENDAEISIFNIYEFEKLEQALTILNK